MGSGVHRGTPWGSEESELLVLLLWIRAELQFQSVHLLIDIRLVWQLLSFPTCHSGNHKSVCFSI